jgi:POT family proton-dependent oligopeptide transporter
VLASMWDEYDHKAWFFAVNCVVAFLAALSILAMIKWLRSIAKEYGA